MPIPEHLKGLTFKPHHFYPGKGEKSGQVKWSLLKEFAIETIRDQHLTVEPCLEAAISLGNESMGVVVSVAVSDGIRHYTCMASVTAMKSDKTEESHAQLAQTRAMKNAVEMFYGISDRDVQEIAAEMKLTPGKVAAGDPRASPRKWMQQNNQNVAESDITEQAEETEEVEEPPQESTDEADKLLGL